MGDSKTCGGQDGLACAAPCPADDRTRERAARLPSEQQITGLELLVLDVLSQDARQRGMPRRAACLALGAALQVTFLVNLSGVCPLLADLRGSRVDQQLTPLVPGVEAGKRHILHAHGYGFLGSQSAVVQRGEERVRPLSSTGPAPDPVEERRRLVRVQQGPLVHGVAGLGDSR